MAAQGGIDDVVGIADTIASPVGTVTTRPLIPVAWQSVAPTLTTGSHPTPPAQGGLESDAPKATDPDFYVGSFALASTTPTLGVGSTTTPPGKGDVGDVFGAPDLGMDAQVAGLAAFQNVAPTIGPVSSSYLPPIAHGDVGDTGGPTTLEGDTNDSNAGSGTLTSWSSGTVTLTLGSIPQPGNHGDIGEMYGQGEGPIGQVVWQVAAPTLMTATTVTPSGNGDITDPYAWQDVVLYRTSWTYPVEMLDAYGEAFATNGGTLRLLVGFDTEKIGLTFGLTGGEMHTGLLTYSNWPAEAIGETFGLISGTLVITTGYVAYNNWPAEKIGETFAMPSGTLVVTVGYITYSNWPAEKIGLTFNLVSGTLV